MPLRVKSPLASPRLLNQFTIEEFTSWKDARKTFFGDEGSITKIISEVKG